MKKLVLASLLASAISLSPSFAAKSDNQELGIETGKKAMKIESGDCSLTIAGKTKVEHFFDRNLALLNREIPDEANYFKNTVDLSFDFAYGKKTFDHDAVKAFTKIRHKGIWGRPACFADSDGMSPAPVKLSDSLFGSHSHTSGKPLIWINEAWLQFSFNAIANVSPERLHTIKFGWFPFELGRGISLGSVYGLNREAVGLYSYPEDKGAPGILLHGDIKKDTLSYDLYYAKFECRTKSIGDTFNKTKEQLIGRKLSPWRGVGEDNDLFAARMKWKALHKSEYGTLEFEPYAFYQSASDQKVKVIADSSVTLGTIGMSVEHAYNGLEWGVEGAFNLGHQLVHAIDQNKIEIKRDKSGSMVEQFSHILDTRGTIKNALVTSDAGNENNSVQAAKQIITNDNSVLVVYDANGIPMLKVDNTPIFMSKKGRVLPGYVNKLRGFFVVTDVTKKLPQYNLDLSAAYGFASGDENPHTTRTCKTHMGFIGVHESYTGKRVSSVMFLDEMRGTLSIPGAIGFNVDTVDNNELSFTNLHHFGFGAKWNPIVAHKKFSFSPNVLFYWRDLAPKKFGKVLTRQKDPITNLPLFLDQNGQQTTTDTGNPFEVYELKTSNEDASSFIGSEFNLKTKIELLKDLELFGNFGMFVPGKMFTDIKGIPFKNAFGDDEFFDQLSEETGEETDTIRQDFRLGTDIAYHVNIGFSYSF